VAAVTSAIWQFEQRASSASHFGTVLEIEGGALDAVVFQLRAICGVKHSLVLTRQTGQAAWSGEDIAILEEASDLISINFENATLQMNSPSGAQYLSSLLKSSDLGILFVEHNGGAVTLTLANDHFFDLFGRETIRFSGALMSDLEKHLNSYCTPANGDAASVIDYFRPGPELTGEILVAAPVERVLRVQSTPSLLHEGEAGRLILFRDVTHDKDIERQLLHSQKMESIGTLAGGIAHDFNNLLTTMLGYAELVKREVDKSNPTYLKIEHIERAAKRAAELTNNLLAFSRRSPTQLTVFDVSDLVRETAGLIRLSVPSSITLSLALADGLPAIEADATQLQQVLINLIINARDALGNDKGGITVTTKIGYDSTKQVKEPPFPYVVMEVEDSGHGISKADLSRIFEPFYTTKEVGKGTGLGLSMVYGIIKQHRGFIEVTSAPMEGSRFSVYLPSTSKKPTPPTKAPGEIKTIGKSNARVLVVDDEPDLLDFCRMALLEICESVTCASNGLEALTLIEATPDDFDLIILDLTMPRMGGVECFHRIRKIKPEMNIIISSGYSLEGGPGDLLRDGASAFLHKPYSVEALLRTVKTHLNLGAALENRA
jgi:signal transduction histidine kinase/ActR/RegA family two-component response regulator